MALNGRADAKIGGINGLVIAKTLRRLALKARLSLALFGEIVRSVCA